MEGGVHVGGAVAGDAPRHAEVGLLAASLSVSPPPVPPGGKPTHPPPAHPTFLAVIPRLRRAGTHQAHTHHKERTHARTNTRLPTHRRKCTNGADANRHAHITHSKALIRRQRTCARARKLQRRRRRRRPAQRTHFLHYSHVPSPSPHPTAVAPLPQSRPGHHFW